MKPEVLQAYEKLPREAQELVEGLVVFLAERCTQFRALSGEKSGQTLPDFGVLPQAYKASLNLDSRSFFLLNQLTQEGLE